MIAWREGDSGSIAPVTASSSVPEDQGDVAMPGVHRIARWTRLRAGVQTVAMMA
ncbi:hypothetical protein ACGFNU_33090 [Spirillospora sp. NPDC048911]|uniref:hypothetical protein n=1 Tax=Spirillospora sp. NPDC048911 TaxID=3364527 RepID=UPI0037242028